MPSPPPKGRHRPCGDGRGKGAQIVDAYLDETLGERTAQMPFSKMLAKKPRRWYDLKAQPLDDNPCGGARARSSSCFLVPNASDQGTRYVFQDENVHVHPPGAGSDAPGLL